MHHIKPEILMQNGKKRSGRGFSPTELKKAGVNPTEAKKIDLPTDFKRKTAHDENIEAIKAYSAKKKAEAKPKPQPQPKPETKKPAAKKKPKS